MSSHPKKNPAEFRNLKEKSRMVRDTDQCLHEESFLIRTDRLELRKDVARRAIIEYYVLVCNTRICNTYYHESTKLRWPVVFQKDNKAS